MQLKRRFILSIFLSLSISTLLSASPEIRKITPPRLESAYLGENVLCHRPLRKGGPRLEVEESEGKILGHVYGHSGSGWTLGPGSAKYVVGLVEEKMAAKNMTKEEPITIIGAGVMGLMSALELIDHGYKNVKIVAASFDNLTSHKAGGQFAPVYMGNDPSLQPLMDQIGVDSYNCYKKIIEGKHKYLKRGATLITDYFENLEDFGLEPYVAAGAMQPSKEVILDFQNGTMRKMYAYDDCIFMDVITLMQDLRAVLEKAGVAFIPRQIESFAEIDDGVVLNCCGLGSMTLAKDSNMISVQGHLILLKDQNPADITYMVELYMGKSQTSTGLDCLDAFYIFPKRLPGTHSNDIGVIGGSYIENADVTTPHLEQFQRVVQNAKIFYGIKE